MGGLIYYVNGRFVADNEASLPLGDLGIVRGYGVFDLLRTYQRVPFRLREHIHRLENSARLIGIELPWSTDELEAIVLSTHKRNAVENATIRIVVTGGSSDNFMTPQQKPSLAVMVNPLVPYAAAYYESGCKVTSTTIERIMPSVKSLNYIGAIMAMAEASRVGAIEAIYKDASGNLSEGTRSNLFVFRGGTLITPKDGVLVGITRQAVLDVARGQFEIAEGPISYEEMDAVDEAFLTSTTKEIVPIVEIDGIEIGGGQPGTQTRKLMRMFRDYIQDSVDRAVTA